MGYYTDFTILLEPFPKGTKPQQDMDSVLDYLEDNLDDGDWESWCDGQLYSNRKWYNQEADMLQISEMFPEYVFHIYGDGENSDDVWEEHWWNGYMQHCHMEIPPFEPDKMQHYKTREYYQPPDENEIQISSDQMSVL